MTEQTPGAEGANDASTEICFSSVNRAVAGAGDDTTRVGPGPDAIDTDLQRRLSEIEVSIQKLWERFDQLEFVIVEQFEPGMTHVGEMPAGNLRDRLDRIEAAVGHLASEPQSSPEMAADAWSDDKDAAAAPDPERHLAGMVARLADLLDEQARRAAHPVETDARLAGLERAVADLVSGMEARHEGLLGSLDGLARRPAPAPDLTAQHRSFAGFATALQTALVRYEASVDRILDALDATGLRLDALEARVTSPDAEHGRSASGGLDASLGALCDRIGALTRVLGADRQDAAAQGLAALSGRLDQLSDLISSNGDTRPGLDRASISETLGDLRMAVAEIAAENRRLRAG